MLIIFISGTLIILSGERLAAFYYIGTIFIYFILVKVFFDFYKHNFNFYIYYIFYNILSSKTSFIDRFYITTINQLKETSSVFSYRHTLHYLTAYEMFLDKNFLVMASNHLDLNALMISMKI